MKTTFYSKAAIMTHLVSIPTGDVRLYGELDIPEGAPGVVLFAHGSGSSRHSPRNQFVGRVLRDTGLGTLLFDLLTPDEERDDGNTEGLRFDIDLLTKRLLCATSWVGDQEELEGLKIGYFGASTGAAAALMAAAVLGNDVSAVVSRGGRPDLARVSLAAVKAPTLLVVGGLDDVVIELNESALAKLRCEKELHIIQGATHLFAEHGKLEIAAQLSARWFCKHMFEVNDGV